MTVRELIEELEKHPNDMRVVMPGYEGGLADICNFEEIPIKLNINIAWYYGPHEEEAASIADEIALIIRTMGKEQCIEDKLEDVRIPVRFSSTEDGDKGEITCLK